MIWLSEFSCWSTPFLFDLDLHIHFYVFNESFVLGFVDKFLSILLKKFVYCIGLVKMVHIATNVKKKVYVLRTFWFKLKCLFYVDVCFFDKILVSALTLHKQFKQCRGKVVIIRGRCKFTTSGQLLKPFTGLKILLMFELMFRLDPLQPFLQLRCLILPNSLQLNNHLISPLDFFIIISPKLFQTTTVIQYRLNKLNLKRGICRLSCNQLFTTVNQFLVCL